MKNTGICPIILWCAVGITTVKLAGLAGAAVVGLVWFLFEKFKTRAVTDDKGGDRRQVGGSGGGHGKPFPHSHRPSDHR